MNRQLTCRMVSLFIVLLAAVFSASAQSISVELAERTPFAAPSDPGMALPPTTMTTTTTTTTLPSIPRCPDTPTSSATAGSQDGYSFWSFAHTLDDCGGTYAETYAEKVYCFENPYVNQALPTLFNWEVTGAYAGPDVMFFQPLAEAVMELAPDHPDACFVCGCARVVGCFPPGVKITMADGSLRNIEDVRAGDLVRNAKTGTPVKVQQVIEGPEALPLIRFGFEGITVTTSQAHPVLTAAGLKAANELKKGDTIFDARGNPHTLTILETLPLEEGQRVINVNLDAAPSNADERLIVSDGIITGDIVLQGLLKERK